MLTIVAVVAASATLQASGGLIVLLQLAEKLLRRNPRYVSLLAKAPARAPVVDFVMLLSVPMLIVSKLVNPQTRRSASTSSTMVSSCPA